MGHFQDILESSESEQNGITQRLNMEGLFHIGINLKNKNVEDINLVQ